MKGKHPTVDVRSQKLKQRKKRKRAKNNVEHDEAARLQRRTRYLLIKMKLEQNLLDAYVGEGWKGQSREKIKPEKELQRAKKQILKCKLGIRDAIRQLDTLGSVGCIDDSAIAPDGSVYHEHIVCAKCKLREAFPDNDIILCDGTCNCAFHQKCLDPPLLTENIPLGDQGWFCKFCECKTEILEAMNAHLGTNFSVDSYWKDIFKEEAALPDGGDSFLHPEREWPSDDSEDDDYDPEKCENSCSYSRTGSEDDASEAASSCSSLWSLECEVFAESGRLEETGCGHWNAEFGADSDETSDCEIICGRRQRRAVDYNQLYEEMFGKDAFANEQISEDEDWGPTKRKRREKESDAASTLMTLCVSEKKGPNENTTNVEENPSSRKTKRPLFRLPPDAVEKLRLVFAKNELPTRAIRENLSKQLGLEFDKVNKWFKNARYLALKARKVEGAQPLDGVSPGNLMESGSDYARDETADRMSLQDISSANMNNTPKELKKIRRRQLLTGPSEENQNKKVLSWSEPNNKAASEFGDDVSLKMLREKAKRQKKTINSYATEEAQEVEAEMERLCKIKAKVEKLQQVLGALPNLKSNKANTPNLNEQSVTFVPVAELREKR